MMKLYYSSGACAISPSIALHESGMVFEPIAVDLATKKTADGRDFYTINKKGSIPVLEISDGVILTEGPAILQYIADQVPDKNLAPKNGTMQRYHFQERLNFVTSELHKIFPIFFDAYGFPEEAKPVARGILRHKFAYIDEVLSKAPYLMGDNFTLVDGYLYNVTRWSPAAGIDVKAEFSNLYAFMERMETRDSVKQTLRTEGIDFFTQQEARVA
jgi:glutathione S-transferase